MVEEEAMAAVVEVEAEEAPVEGDPGKEEYNDTHDKGLRPGQEISTWAHVCAKQSAIQIQTRIFLCTIVTAPTRLCQEEWES